jgi:hypothetical protein
MISQTPPYRLLQRTINVVALSFGFFPYHFRIVIVDSAE